MPLDTDQIKQIRDPLDAILSVNREKLITRSEWGTITFSGADGALASIFEMLGILRDLPYERITSNSFAPLRDALVAALAVVARINSFDLNRQSPSAERDQIVSEIIGVEQQLTNAVQGWIAYLAYLKGDIPAQLANVTRAASDAALEYDAFKKRSAAQHTEIEQIVAAAREASAKAGVAHFALDFSNDANEREADAGKWLKASVISAAATFIVAVGFLVLFLIIELPKELPHLVQMATSKLVILALLIAVTAWCAGNYKASKHQAAVSRFKAHALGTFQAFVKASDNPLIREAVLLETTRSIFSQPASGYLKGDSGGSDGSKVIEILKGTVGSNSD
jgi:hypothetical protein